jgi:hypothetical protein
LVVAADAGKNFCIVEGRIMATLTADELQDIRQRMASKYAEQNWRKKHINDAAQAVEDQYTSVCRQHLMDAIEAAVPGKFDDNQKRRIVRLWMKVRMEN